MGIRRRIMLGFGSLALLMFFSGVISTVELDKLGKSTQSVLDKSTKSIELSRIMLDALQEQNFSLYSMISVNIDIQSDSIFRAAKIKFENALNESYTYKQRNAELDIIYIAKENFYNEVDSMLMMESDSLRLITFGHISRTSYQDISRSIKDYIVSTQNIMENDIIRLEENAHRAIMPAVVALAVAIIIIFIFFYLIDLYYLKQIVRINKGLNNYFNLRIPFAVKVEGNDEVATLAANIDKLITALKSIKK